MEKVTQKEFDKRVENEARLEYNSLLRRGQFVPLSFIRNRVRNKLLYQLTISKEKSR